MKKYSLGRIGCTSLLILSGSILKGQTVTHHIQSASHANYYVDEASSISNHLANATEDVSKRTLFSSTWKTKDGKIIIKYSSFLLNYPDEKGHMQPFDKKAMSSSLIRGTTSKWMGGSTPSCLYPNFNTDSLY